MRIKSSTRGRIFIWVIILGGLCFYTQPILTTLSRQNRPAPVINEFLAANQTGLTDTDGDYSDWIEIYNPDSRPVNLAGWSLTDDLTQPEKWTFPNMSLAGGEYLIVFASGKDRKTVDPGLELHTNFKLNQAGEFLALYNVVEDEFSHPFILADNEALAVSGYPHQFDDIAYGLYGSLEGGLTPKAYGYLAPPSPGNPNPETPLWVDQTRPVNFSRPRGFYDTSFTLELSTPTPDTTIRYTTDGSEPTEGHGTVYTGPITIESTVLLRAIAFKPNFRPSPVGTHTYILLDDVITQSGAPPSFPKSWGGYQGTLVRADYEMDPEIVNNPRYGNVMAKALTSIPSISIVTDIQSFHHLYANPQRRGAAWERPVSIELIDPHNQQPGFQIDAGLRIQGESGRLEYMPKHGFRLFFRDKYGADKLEYPLFPNSPIDQFDTLVLRSGVNRSYAGLPEFDQSFTAYTRDEWLRASQLAMSGSGSRGIFVHLYLNGLYWGLYNVVERPDAAFMAAYFGGAEDDWQTISHEETVSHSSERFKMLHQLAAEGSLEDTEKYQTLKTYLDVPHFIDYLILNWYTGNIDWAFNNWYAGVGNESEPIKYFVWDGERIWDTGAEIFFHRDEYLDRPNLVQPLIEALLENPDFRMELADRMYRHLFNNGVLTEANSQARWQRLNQQIEQAVIAESARWGDVREEMPLTQEDWFKARDDVLAQMEGNVSLLVSLAREEGYYPDIDPPEFRQQAGQIGSHSSLTMTLLPTTMGTIYYTTDGSDPRLPVTGRIAPEAKIYDAPVILTTPLHIKARVYDGTTWSALNETVFEVDGPADGRLQITEIMYNPPGGDDYEFVELTNTGHTDLDLTNLTFEGITFTFPPTSLRSNEIIVLVRNPDAFAQRYPGVSVGGIYGGQLSNKGETITLQDADGHILLSVAYDDERGWPLSPDGHGDSLVLVDQAKKEPSKPEFWRSSTHVNGSPGAVDFIP